jgi:hypothetical protein
MGGDEVQNATTKAGHHAIIQPHGRAPGRLVLDSPSSTVDSQKAKRKESRSAGGDGRLPPAIRERTHRLQKNDFRFWHFISLKILLFCSG